MSIVIELIRAVDNRRLGVNVSVVPANFLLRSATEKR